MHFAEKGIEILVYKNDSLKFWTSNVFAAPLILDNENFHRRRCTQWKRILPGKT